MHRAADRSKDPAVQRTRVSGEMRPKSSLRHLLRFSRLGTKQTLVCGVLYGVEG